MHTRAFVLVITTMPLTVSFAAGAAGDARLASTVRLGVVESETAEPGLTYGHTDALPLPKTIFFGAGVDDIIADAEEWKRRGVTAFFVDYVAREWSTDIWAGDGKPWTIGASDETFQKARQAAEICKRIGSETFLKVAFDHCFEWFNDVAWQRADNNFRQFAIFARDCGFTGIALDIEYVGEQYDYNWEGYTYDGYTREDLVRKIEERMTRVLGILYDEFPDMVFLTFPEQGLGLGNVIHTAWIEEAARRNAPGGVHYCTEWTYRRGNIRYVFGHAWSCNLLFRKVLSAGAWQYWQNKCTIAAGFWPFSSDDRRVYGPVMEEEDFKQCYAATLMVSPRYSWIYGSYTQEQVIGRELEKYTEEKDIHHYLDMLTAREMVTTPKYVALAQELRKKTLRDYASDLGLRPTPFLVGPNDAVRVSVMPTEFAQGSLDIWDLGLRIFEGEAFNLQERFQTQVEWMLIGPFGGEPGLRSHDTVYPPEEAIDLDAQYDGAGGKAAWTEYVPSGGLTSVDLTQVYETTEHVSAYGLCYVSAPRDMAVQLRVGTNDAGKLWVGGELVYDYPYEGEAMLDRDIISVTLRRGTTPILIKATNGEKNWGFVFRITDLAGRPIPELKLSARAKE